MRSLIGQYGFSDHKWPEKEDEMQSWCKAIPKDGKAAKNYVKKCLHGMSGTIMSVTIYGAEKVARGYCNNPQERDAYMSRGKCGNKAKPGTTKCWNNIINVMTNIKHLNVSSAKIPSFCCSFFEWRDCTLNEFNKMGAPVCSQQDIEGFSSHISRGSLDPLNMLCADYDDSDKCDKIMDKIERKPTTTRFRTMFPALMEMFDTL
ncbi:uncharacterized protein LOC128953685 [Oppia nitens]|uniref:uncharacterized protein LOC128953685 n=1 Tax=Oppia nitens TaxID=1686743 RepID=UPI0023DB281E|nr:uncharacterized protein LOC128953685 [Oppia nitens]